MLPLLTLRFSNPFSAEGIESLRHTFIVKALEHRLALAKHYLHPDLFTNEDENGRAYDRYPLIQYKAIAGQATVTGIAQGATALGMLWEKWEDAPLHNHTQMMRGKDTFVLWKETIIREAKKLRHYQLTDWLPCNQRDVQRYSSLNEGSDKETFLTEKLSMHIEKLNSDLRLGLPGISIESLHVSAEKLIRFRTPRPRPVVDCSFAAAIRLPAGIGLGNSPAFGFGVVTRLNKKA